MNQRQAGQSETSTEPADTQTADILKKRTAALSDLMTLVYKLAAGLGALAAFAYLFLISFFPAGMTPGEVLFFVFIALAFSFTYLAFLAYGAISALWFVHLLYYVLRSCRLSPANLLHELFPDIGPAPQPEASATRWHFSGARAAWRRFRLGATRLALDNRSPVPKFLRGYIFAGLSLFMSVFFAYAAYEIKSDTFSRLILAAVVAGFFVLLFLGGPELARTTREVTMARVLGLAIVPMTVTCIYAGPRPLLDLVFEGLGIRSSNVSLELPADEVGGIERISELIRRPLIDCRRPKPERIIVHGGDVLWTGIGEQTLVQFSADSPAQAGLFSASKTGVPQGRIQFETKSVRIIKTNPRLDPCFDLPSDLLFDTGKFDLTPAARDRVQELSQTITRLGTPAKIVVRGHSDPRRIAVGGDGTRIDNQILSERRAAAIASILHQQINRPGLQIVHEGAGSREPRITCSNDSKSTGYEQDQCNKPNRRVEVRVTYQR